MTCQDRYTCAVLLVRIREIVQDQNHGMAVRRGANVARKNITSNINLSTNYWSEMLGSGPWWEEHAVWPTKIIADHNTYNSVILQHFILQKEIWHGLYNIQTIVFENNHYQNHELLCAASIPVSVLVGCWFHAGVGYRLHPPYMHICGVHGAREWKRPDPCR